MPHRKIDVVYPITLKNDRFGTAIERFKYKGKAGWAPIFARLIIGWLEEQNEWQDPMIIINPTAPDRQPIRHTETLLRAMRAENNAGKWRLDDPDDPVVIKTRSTPKSAGQSWDAKFEAAEELRSAIKIQHANRLANSDVLIVDDIATTLLQLNVLADLLKDVGCPRVGGVVLARAVHDQ